jgi:hypothetical protein
MRTVFRAASRLKTIPLSRSSGMSIFCYLYVRSLNQSCNKWEKSPRIHTSFPSWWEFSSKNGTCSGYSSAGLVCSESCLRRTTRVSERSELFRKGLTNTKSPEVMLISFISASSSRLDPCRPALIASLRVATRDLAWAPGLPPTGQISPTPRDSILPLTGAPVLLDQRFAIDPYGPSLGSRLATGESDLA